MYQSEKGYRNMNFSKLLALLLALVMLLSIVACDKPSGNEGNQTTDETTVSNEETTAGKEETTHNLFSFLNI